MSVTRTVNVDRGILRLRTQSHTWAWSYHMRCASFTLRLRFRALGHESRDHGFMIMIWWGVSSSSRLLDCSGTPSPQKDSSRIPVFLDMSRPLPPPCSPIFQLARLASAPHPNVATWIAPPQLVSSAEGGTGSTAAHYLLQTFDLCDCDLIALVQSQPGRRLGEGLARELFAQVLTW